MPMVRGMVWLMPGIVKHFLICSWRGHDPETHYRFRVCLRCGLDC